MNKSVVMVALFVTLITNPAYADGRCPANDMGCNSSNYQEKIDNRIQQGKKEVFNSSSPSQAAKAVGRTVQDCTDCATKVFQDSLSGASAAPAN